MRDDSEKSLPGICNRTDLTAKKRKPIRDWLKELDPLPLALDRNPCMTGRRRVIQQNRFICKIECFTKIQKASRVTPALIFFRHVVPTFTSTILYSL